MGQSASADFFYGLVFNEGTRPWSNPEEDEDEEDEDWEERYARLQGVVRPTEPYPEGTLPRGAKSWEHDKRVYTPDEQAVRKCYDAYWGRKREVCAASPVEVDFYGHCDYSCTFVAVRASHLNSNFCESPIDGKRVRANPKWRSEVIAFCEFMGIPYDESKIGWHLVAGYG